MTNATTLHPNRSPTAAPEPVVRDLMSTELVVVRPTTPVRELVDVLVSRRVTGVPVVSDRGSPVGVVSMTDVMRLASHELEVGPAIDFEEGTWEDDSGRSAFFMDATVGVPLMDTPLPHAAFDGWTVEDIMTPATFSVRPDATVQELARFLLRGQIHRALVTGEGRLIGIVTTSDVVRAVATGVE